MCNGDRLDEVRPLTLLVGDPVGLTRERVVAEAECLRSSDKDGGP